MRRHKRRTDYFFPAGESDQAARMLQAQDERHQKHAKALMPPEQDYLSTAGFQLVLPSVEGKN